MLTLFRKTYTASAELNRGTFFGLNDAERQEAMKQVAEVMNYMLGRCGPRTTHLNASLSGTRMDVTVEEKLGLLQGFARVFWLPAEAAKATRTGRNPLTVPLTGEYAPQNLLDYAVTVTDHARVNRENPLKSFMAFMAKSGRA